MPKFLRDRTDDLDLGSFRQSSQLFQRTIYLRCRAVVVNGKQKSLLNGNVG
jgi:hypothetical protein